MMIKRRGFTLIELLIVIAIVAVLATVTLLVLNPSEMLRKSRDSKRFSDSRTINDAISLAVAQISPPFIGTSTYVYVSLPDNNPTCASHNLPSLNGTGKTYSCQSLNNYRKTNGTGWIPVNFDNYPLKVLAVLPIDPVNNNNASSGLYYTYITDGNSWEIDSKIESIKYGPGGTSDVSANDGGDTSLLFEGGGKLTLTPPAINDRTGAPQAPTDITPPAAITNLAASNPTSNSIDLSWTAPGDDNATGTATSYDIRYATSSITSSNWNSTTLVSGEPAPQVAGTNQSMTISGLAASAHYYFAMETSDEVPNVSDLSNVANNITLAQTLQCSQGSISLSCTCGAQSYVTGYCCDVNNGTGGVYFDSYYPSCPVEAGFRYVSNSGVDSKDGLTPTSSWKTINKAAQTLQPGQTAIILGGVYDEANTGAGCSDVDEPMGPGTLRPARSGTTGNYITYKGHPDYPRPVMKGGNYTRPAVCIDSLSWIILDYLEVTESHRGIYISGDDFLGITSTYITVKNCSAHDTIETGGNSNNNGGIFLGYGGGVSNITVRGNELYRNYGDFGGGDYHASWNNVGIMLYNTTNSTVEENIVHDQKDGSVGIRFKHCDSGNIARRNRIYNVSEGIVQSSDGCPSGYIDIYENIIYNIDGGGIGVAGDDTSNARLFNNVVYDASAGYGTNPEGTITNVMLRNNIAMNSNDGYYAELNTESANHPGFSSNYNIFYNTGTSLVALWDCNWNSPPYSCGGSRYNLANYRAISGQDVNSLQINPLFISTNPADPDFLHPAINSPAIDAGTIISGYHCALSDDNGGAGLTGCKHWCSSAPDIGAFEHC